MKTMNNSNKIVAKYVIIFAMMLSLSASTFAQTYTIKGKIVDQNTNENLMFVNCVLYNAKDTLKQISGVAADTNGVFQFKNIKKQDLLLTLTFVGYEKKVIEIKSSSFNGNMINLGIIELKTLGEGLKEVEIIAQKDRIKLDADKMTMNIDKNTASSVTNAFELLKKAPGISIDNDDNLKLNGKGGVLIQFQSRDMKLPWKSMVQILKGIPSSQIDKFEIINNPSAKYDAEGVAGIINIIFKQDKNQGLNASLGTDVYYSEVLSKIGNLNVNYVDDKWTSSLSFSATSWAQNMENNSERKVGIGLDTIRSIENQNFEWASQNYNLNLGTDYQINKKNSVGLYFTYSNNTTPTINYPTSTIISNLRNGVYVDSLAYKSQSSMYNNSNNYLINANYQHKFDTLGQNLSFNFDYVWNDGKDKSGAENKYYNYFINTINPYKQELINNSTNSTYSSYVFRSDYFKPFSQTFSLETGLKLGFTRVNNDYVSLLDNINQVNKSNNFIYDENINAIYGSLKKSFSQKTSLRLGLRVENTNIKGNQVKYDSSFTQNYTNFFPNLSFSHSFSDKSTLNFAYNLRISRPSYNNLNPFTLWSNDYTYSKGNPELKPQYTHNFSLQHTFMYVLFSSLTYSYTKDIVSEIPFTSANGFITFSMPENIQNSHNLNLNVSASIPIKTWWTIVGYLSENYTNNNSQKDGLSFNNEFFTFMGYGSSSFTLPKNYKISLSGYYMNGGTWGVYKYKSFYGLNINANKTFFKDLLTVSVGVNNLLSRKGSSVYYNYGNTSWKQDQTFN
ncbi:MAG: outer membrane beta-barrel family protein, partial [Bacteroidales bacterium]|nr:outer membrane beta-barrel family protein [Bacteroidales bacterium]